MDQRCKITLYCNALGRTVLYVEDREESLGLLSNVLSKKTKKTDLIVTVSHCLATDFNTIPCSVKDTTHIFSDSQTNSSDKGSKEK